MTGWRSGSADLASFIVPLFGFAFSHLGNGIFAVENIGAIQTVITFTVFGNAHCGIVRKRLGGKLPLIIGIFSPFIAAGALLRVGLGRFRLLASLFEKVSAGTGYH
jgi:hypothetical protein